MRKAFRHTGVLMMLGVVALGLIGAAYTLWYENLTLTANVSTGTLDADWSCEEFQITGGGPNSDGPGAGGVDDDFDCTGASRPVWSNGTGSPLTWNQFSQDLLAKAPSCSAAIGGPANVPGNPSNTVGDANQLTLNLGGLYPYAGCEFSIDIHSDGSVPIHFAVTSASFTPNAPSTQAQADALWSALQFEVMLPNADAGQCAALWAAIEAKKNNPSGPAVVVPNEPNGNAALQLHYSDEVVCNVRVWLAQRDVEGVSGTLNVTIQAHQWNEAANPAAP